MSTAVGIGLNSFGAIIWPVHLLGLLAGATELVDVTLDQMGPGSPLLKTLAASPDPHTPYTIIAGNTTMIQQVQQSEQEGSRFERLLGQLAPMSVLRGITSLAFFRKPNDIAVEVESMLNIPGNRSPQPITREVDCDHLTYFNTVPGLQAIAEALHRT